MSKKVTFSSEALNKCLKKLAFAVSEKMVKILPFTKNVLISIDGETATLVTSDIETTIEATCDVESSGGSFKIVLPFKYLQQIVAHAENLPITIEHPSSRTARIIAGQDVYEQKSLEKPEDFVKVPDRPVAASVMLNEAFLRSLTFAKSSLSKDENSPVLMRACLELGKEQVKIVGTDRYVLYSQMMDNIEVPESLQNQNILLSPKLADILKGENSFSLFLGDNITIAQSSGLTVWMKNVEGKFPNYRVIIPGHDPNLTVSRKEFIAALEKASINANEMLRATLDLEDPKGIVIEMDNQDQACKNRIKISGKYTGNAPSVSVNASKMISVLNQVECEHVTLHITAPNKAVLVTSEENPGFFSLVMPLMIN